MVKRRYISLIHQFYKELKLAYSMGYPIIPLLKFFPKYVVQNRLKRDRLEMGIPWLVKDVVDFINKNFKKGQKVFEFGSGASTHYFLKHGFNLVSVEHDKNWFEKVDSFLKSKDFQNYSLNLVEPYKRSHSVNPVTSGRDSRFIGYDYSEYSSFIKKFPDNYFDVILIDGRVRTECLKNSISKLKIGGFLVFDNTERKAYREAIDLVDLKIVLKSFGFVDFDLGFTETSVFRK